LYCMVVKEMEKLDGYWHEKKSTTKRDGEIGWILTWEKINGFWDMINEVGY
jgi:hypothetical protein